jgi:hypothetical protein
LLFHVRLGGDHADLSRTQAEEVEKFTHLRQTSPDAGNLFDPGRRFVHGGGRMLFEIGLQRLAVFGQLTLRFAEMERFEGFNPTFLVLAQVLTQCILRDTQDSSNLTMRQAVALQQQRLHLPLDPRMRMVESLVAEFVYRFFRELNLDHWALLAIPRKTMPQVMRPVRQFTPGRGVARRADQYHIRAEVCFRHGESLFSHRREKYLDFSGLPNARNHL